MSLSLGVEEWGLELGAVSLAGFDYFLYLSSRMELTAFWDDCMSSEDTGDVGRRRDVLDVWPPS